MPSPSEQLKFQTTTLRNLVAGVRPDQWDNPTACAKWTVRDVTNHVVGGGHMVAASFRGEAVEFDPDGDMPDMLGGNPVAAIEAMIADIESSADAPGAMDGEVTLPFATLPAPVALGVGKFDLLLHCWDIASATGQPFDPPADVVAEGQQFAEMLIAPEARDGNTFGAEVTPPSGATPMLKLAAFSGRQV